MGMVVRTNVMAMNANRSLGTNNTQVGKSLEKLSSGFRINRAADDASGLAISEKMKAQIKGLEQASSNSQDGISLIQTAEGATQEIHNMLNRMVELATKSANGTIQNDVDRDAIQREVDDLNSEITRISSSTNFNGIKLLDGSLGGTAAGTTTSVTDIAGKLNGNAIAAGTDVGAKAAKFVSGAVTYGADAASLITVSYTDADGKAQTKDISVTANTNAATSARAAETAIAGDATLGQLFKATTGASGNGIAVENKTAGASKAAITNIAFKSGTGITAVAAGTATAGAEATKSFDLSATPQAGDSVTIDGKEYTFATGADGTDGATFSNLNTLKAAAAKNGVTLDTTTNTAVTATKSGTGAGLTLQVGDTNDTFNQVTVSVADLSAKGLAIDTLKVDTQTDAGNSIATIKTAINTVSTNRANLGSLQNRLEYTINNLDTTTENMTSANSRIRDTDMAKEMMNYTKMNILTQAAQAMLAQANQQPQAILQLLQ